MTTAKKATAKKTAAKKTASKAEEFPTDLATSGRDSEMAAEDAKSTEKVTEKRQAQAARATGGAPHGRVPDITTADLNPAFYPKPE